MPSSGLDRRRKLLAINARWGRAQFRDGSLEGRGAAYVATVFIAI
jgi:hypothetical protein